MKNSINESMLTSSLKQRNGYLVIALGLVVLCLILAGIIYHLAFNKRTYIVPPQIQRSFWVADNEVSPEYLSEMTTFFTSLRLNITSSNISHQHEMLLRYTDPSYYGQLKTILIAEAEHLTKNHLSSAFYPVDVKVNSSELTATITGDIKSFVGKESLPDKRVNYQLRYRYHNSRLLVFSFQLIQPEA
jgi:conjugal transfer pilus assembly protein TraE